VDSVLRSWGVKRHGRKRGKQGSSFDGALFKGEGGPGLGIR